MAIHPRLLPGLAAAALVTGSLIGIAASAPATAASPTVTLVNDLVPHLGTYRDLGATNPAQKVQVDLTLARPQAAQEQALFNAMYDPSSASYHHFLTPAQFDARFGVPQATYDAAKAFGTAHGLSVVNSQGSRDLLVLSGTVAQVNQTFGVTTHDYRGDGNSFHANTQAPTVPANLGITGVIGLNSLLGSHLFHNSNAQAMPAGATHGATPAQGTCLGSTCLGTTTPQDLWSIYEQPGATADPNGNTTDDFGQGQSMAVFGEGQTDPVIANLRTFEQTHGLPQVPIDVVHADGPNADYSDNAGEIEWDLDTQASTGMSPDVQREVLYFGSDLSDASVLNVFNAWADDPNGPLQANASYGECEENPIGDALASTPIAFSAGQAYTAASEAALIKANLEGRTLFSSAGDTGSSCPIVPAATLNGVTNELVPIVNYPASSPHAVDVGGTVLYGTDSSTGTPATRSLEYTWTYTGGGTSLNFAEPDYQKGISTILTGFRGAPDVAAQSGDVATNGYGIVADGETDYPGGGTSLSSPLWMGMWTRIQAAAPAVGGSYPGLGFANPALYAQYGSSHQADDFFDIGGGTSSPPAGNGIYVSTPGWDYTSGMGTPRVANLAQNLTGSTAPANPVLP